MSIAPPCALALLLAAAPTHALAGADPVPHVDLLWIEPDGATPAAHAMAESRGILRRVGVDARWTRADSLLVDPSQTPIILLRGRRLRGAGGAFVMGATHAASDSRAVWIYPDAIAATMGFGRIPEDPSAQGAFGLAVGRVIAHEVVHSLLGSSDHARFGLMAESLDRRALLAPSLAVDPDTRRALERVPMRRSPEGALIAAAKPPL